MDGPPEFKQAPTLSSCSVMMMNSGGKMPYPANLNSSSSSNSTVRLPCAEGMDDLFKNTLHKLTESMKRSAESRRSLKIKTEHTQEYERSLCVHQILQSVENSSRQVDTCLQIYRHPSAPNEVTSTDTTTTTTTTSTSATHAASS